MIAFTPHEVLALDLRPLVDIRPPAERSGSLGFIPGSINVDPRVGGPAFSRVVRALPGKRPIVLVCTSGARARRCALELGENTATRLGFLSGGILGWGASGLPLSGREISRQQTAISPAEFSRTVASCFVAETADFAIDTDVDPLELLRRCFELASADFDAPSPAGMRRVLDYAAAVSLSIGTPWTRVAANVDAMLELLPPWAEIDGSGSVH